MKADLRRETRAHIFFFDARGDGVLTRSYRHALSRKTVVQSILSLLRIPRLLSSPSPRDDQGVHACLRSSNMDRVKLFSGYRAQELSARSAAGISLCETPYVWIFGSGLFFQTGRIREALLWGRVLCGETGSGRTALRYNPFLQSRRI